MIQLVVCASTFSSNQSACLQRAMELSKDRDNSKTCLLLDDSFLKNYNKPAVNDIPVNVIHIRDYINGSQKPLKVELRERLPELNINDMILLDARYHDTHVIMGVLYEMSFVFFHMPVWHPAILLVADDHHAAQITEAISDIFYIRALSTSKHAINSEFRTMRMHIFSHRWFGLGRLSRLARSMYIFLQKLKRHANKYIT